MATNGDILRMAFRWNIAGVGDIVNVHHFQVLTQDGSPDDDALIADIIDTVISDAYDLMAVAVRDTVVGVDVDVFNVTSATPLGAHANLTFGTNSTTDASPTQTAPLAVWRTATLRRQGRTYFPPLVEGSVIANGQIESSNLATFAAWAAAMIGVFSGTLCTFQKVIQSSSDSTFSPIISAGVQTFLRTQRRRRSGVGV